MVPESIENKIIKLIPTVGESNGDNGKLSIDNIASKLNVDLEMVVLVQIAWGNQSSNKITKTHLQEYIMINRMRKGLLV